LEDKGVAALGITLYEVTHWYDHQSANNVTHPHITTQQRHFKGITLHLLAIIIAWLPALVEIKLI
jgi:hypothetical protein